MSYITMQNEIPPNERDYVRLFEELDEAYNEADTDRMFILIYFLSALTIKITIDVLLIVWVLFFSFITPPTLIVIGLMSIVGLFLGGAVSTFSLLVLLLTIALFWFNVISVYPLLVLMILWHYT